MTPLNAGFLIVKDILKFYLKYKICRPSGKVSLFYGKGTPKDSGQIARTGSTGSSTHFLKSHQCPQILVVYVLQAAVLVVKLNAADRRVNSHARAAT